MLYLLKGAAPLSFKVELHGLFLGQEARMHAAAPTFLRCSESLLPWGILAGTQAATEPALFVQVLAACTKAEQQQAKQPQKERGKTAQLLQVSRSSLKGSYAVWMSGSSLSLLLLQNEAFIRHSNALSLCWCFRMDKHWEKHPWLYKGPDTHGF